ncbi:MAG: metallophosphoesterase [Planctomycetia bacterium]|nr:metallophosphoesterase [Planctomycetia bacterium]
MIRFGAIADIQYGDLDMTIGRDYRASLTKLLAASGAFNSDVASFVMNFGDSLQSDWENAQAIGELFQITGKAGIKWRHVLGNHDFLVPRVQKAKIYELLNVPKPGYYDFSLSDPEDEENRWHVVVLNGNEISTYSAETDEEYERAVAERDRCKLANGKLPADWNGSISKTQLEWLDSTLTKAEEQDKNIIVCSHFPLFCQTRSLNGSKTKIASIVNLDMYFFTTGISTWNGQELLDILDKHKNIRGYLAGHLHEGSYGVRNNVAHVTFKGVVETSPNAYAFVELEKNAIIVEGHEAQPSYTFEF